MLCGRAATADIVDAVVVILAVRHRAGVVTADSTDIERLASALTVKLRIFTV